MKKVFSLLDEHIAINNSELDRVSIDCIDDKIEYFQGCVDALVKLKWDLELLVKNNE